MRFAYADPPYRGMAKAYEGGVEVNFPLLIAHLVQDFPDGWAMSCHTPSLRYLLPLCPPTVRVGAWVKPFASFKPGVNPAYAWEPVLFMGGRRRGRDRETIRDWVAASIAFERNFFGAKPNGFCWWVFALLGMEPSDELEDLFPGSGAVTRAWEHWKMQRPLPRSATVSTLPLLGAKPDRIKRRKEEHGKSQENGL